MARFPNKAVLVTGGSRGIGRAIVEAFGREGANVAFGYLDPSPADATELVNRLGADRCLAVAGDVADGGAVLTMVEQTVARLGRVDILVNCAGICPFTDVLELTIEEFDRVQAVNLRGVFIASQAAARHMRRTGGGAIINITSISGERFTNPRQLAYCVSKAAANMLTRGLAVTLAPYNIRVNAVLPGTIPTDINRDILASPGVTESIVNATPLKCLGSPQDIASTVLYLASDEARWITGTLMVVDGGFIA